MKARHAPVSRGWRRAARVAVFVLAGLVVLGGGAAFATYRYEEANAGRILPGISIDGVDVGGMTRDEAVAALRAAAEDRLSREILVRAGDERWRITPAELGMEADVERKVDLAVGMNSRFPWHERALRRLLDRPLGEAFDLRYARDGRALGAFLKEVAEAVAVEPENAGVFLIDGEIVIDRGTEGAALKDRHARRALMQAVRADRSSVKLALRTVEPDVAPDDLGQTIVVRLSENRLYLYEGLRVAKTYDVATGTAQYPTPQGTWTIWDKRENPTWINPAPDGWGANLPAVIGPGPGNPLGTHALYLDAPGIRIHGTYAEDSIGTYASHGCVRMTLADSKELFEIVEIGTKVHILP
jgi:lipoprotein-anchoring transpeptidase ErfK/SrfK